MSLRMLPPQRLHWLRQRLKCYPEHWRLRATPWDALGRRGNAWRQREAKRRQAARHIKRSSRRGFLRSELSVPHRGRCAFYPVPGNPDH